MPLHIGYWVNAGMEGPAQIDLGDYKVPVDIGIENIKGIITVKGLKLPCMIVISGAGGLVL